MRSIKISEEIWESLKKEKEKTGKSITFIANDSIKKYLNLK